MTELDALKKAMQGSDMHMVPRLDLPAIMAEGRRLRTRRRLGYTGAGAASIAMVTVAVVALAPAPADRSAQPPQSVSTGSPAGPATVPATLRPSGALVRTGLRDSAGERVYFFTTIDVPGEPGLVTSGLNAGRLSDTGTLTSDLLLDVVWGADGRTGFHGIGYDPSGGPPGTSSIPTFGYFTGPARRIEGVVREGKQPVAANVASWSEDTNMKIFWFDPARLPPGQPLDGIQAYGIDGKKL